MCTRDWQRRAAQANEGVVRWPGLSYVTTLEADGSFGRRFLGCTCHGSTRGEHRADLGVERAADPSRAAAVHPSMAS